MILSRAPYRISLGGGGTDLPSYYERHGGFILSAAVDKFLYIYINRPAADNFIRLKYSRYEQVVDAAELEHDLVRLSLGHLAIGPSLEIASMADVPAGTGLGSSGTYLVALLLALRELKRERIATHELAEEACHIEMDLAKHPAGKHDPYLAAFGGVTCLEIATDGAVAVTPLNVATSTLDDFRSNVLLFYTGVVRRSSEILEAQRQDTQREDPVVVESLHRTKEIGYRVKEALEAGDLERFGLLLDEHWQNKKRRSTKISDPNLDRWYEMVKEQGGLGGKVMGAGGGGFFMFYCPQRAKAGIRRALTAEGLREMPYSFDLEGAKVVANF